MAVIRRAFAACAALAAVVVLGVVQASAQPAPPAVASASLTSTTCPGSGCADLNVSGYASVAVQLSGTWSATVTFRGSVDGTNFQTINCTPTNSTTAATSSTTTGVWFCSVTGLKFARAVVTSYTSGTVAVTMQAAASGGGSGGGGGGGGSTPTNTIGAAISTSVVPMGGKDGSGNAQTATFDVSGNMLVAVTGAGSGGTSSTDGAVYTAGTTAGTPAMLARDDTAPTALAEDRVGIPRGSSNRNLYIQLRDGAGNERGANVSAAGALAVDGSAVTQPVSAASLPLPTGAATSAEQTTGNSSLSSIDGKTPALVSGRVPVDGSGVTQPVSGTFWQATQPVSISGNQAVNLAQVAGASTATGNGTAAGSIRVALPTDGTGVVGLNAGTNLVGSVGRKNTFDSAVTMTTTNFTSLGSGSGWGGGAITTSGCSDIRFRVLTKGSSASNTLYVDFFLATAIAGETTFDDAASASEGAFTAANRKNSRQVGTVLMNGTSAVQGSFSALDTFPTLPAEIVPIAINSSGAALSSTGADHVIKYECVR